MKTEVFGNSRRSSPRIERSRIAVLSSDLPALWHAPGTTHRDRKEIIRHLVEKIVVHGKIDSEYVDVTIHWQGGFISQHEVLRPLVCTSNSATSTSSWTASRPCGAKEEPRDRYRRRLEPGRVQHAEAAWRVLSEIVNQLLKRRGLANAKTSTNQLGPHEWWLRS